MRHKTQVVLDEQGSGLLAPGGERPDGPLLCLAVGLPLSRLHTAKSRLQNRDGYVAVALGWIVLSAFGALPYALSGCCGYVDALFETVSGFTTLILQTSCISNLLHRKMLKIL